MYIIIVGCGRVGSELAKLLADEGHNVVVIDKDSKAFQRLGNDFNGATVTGNGFDVDLLKEAADIEQADAFCTVTDNDNANLMSGQVAKKIFHIRKVITRINDVQYKYLYREQGIDIVNSTILLTSVIRNKIIDNRFSSFLLEDSRLETLEIKQIDKLVGKRVEQVNLGREFVVGAILRKKKELFIARPKDVIEKNDILFGLVSTESLAKVKKALGLEE